MSQPTTATDAVTPEAETQEQEEDYDIPEEVETVIGQFQHPVSVIHFRILQYPYSGHNIWMSFFTEYLLVGLKDKETIVRWSAAKG